MKGNRQEQDNGVMALIQLAEADDTLRAQIVNHEGVQRHLVLFVQTHLEKQLHSLMLQPLPLPSDALLQQGGGYVGSMLPAPMMPGPGTAPGFGYDALGGFPCAGPQFPGCDPAVIQTELAVAPMQVAQPPTFPPGQLQPHSEPSLLSTDPPPCTDPQTLLARMMMEDTTTLEPSYVLLEEPEIDPNAVLDDRGCQQRLLNMLGVSPSGEAAGTWDGTYMTDWQEAPQATETLAQKTKRKKSKDKVVEEFRAGETSVIVKGVPADCTRHALERLLQEGGFGNQFDVLYMPKNFENHQNKGYVHINFRQAENAECFVRWVQNNTARVSSGLSNASNGKRPANITVCRATVQGFAGFVKSFGNGRRLRTRNPDNLPWIYMSENFPEGQPLTAEAIRSLPHHLIAEIDGIESGA